jgi:hypothetical protein
MAAMQLRSTSRDEERSVGGYPRSNGAAAQPQPQSASAAPEVVATPAPAARAGRERRAADDTDADTLDDAAPSTAQVRARTRTLVHLLVPHLPRLVH